MKGFKVAEIVPISCLDFTQDNGYHICLSHIALTNDSYADFYKRMASEGKYVLLDFDSPIEDNVPFEDLINLCKRIQPAEITIPDVLLDTDATIKRAREFYTSLTESGFQCKLMIVPQGKSVERWIHCFEELLYFIPASSVGISKFLSMTTHDDTSRLRVIDYLRDYAIDIHLLGCDIGSITAVAGRKLNERVRGCDSSFAYICAKAGSTEIRYGMQRPDVNCDLLNDPRIDNLDSILKSFEKTMGVEYNGPSESWRI